MLDKIYRVYKATNLRNRQRRIEKRIKEEGLTDEILNEQLKINAERNELDIPDFSEKVFDDFVQ